MTIRMCNILDKTHETNIAHTFIKFVISNFIAYDGFL